jgi:hypothetical protein
MAETPAPLRPVNILRGAILLAVVLILALGLAWEFAIPELADPG